MRCIAVRSRTSARSLTRLTRMVLIAPLFRLAGTIRAGSPFRRDPRHEKSGAL